MSHSVNKSAKKSVGQLTTSQLNSHSFNSQSATLSVNESFSQKVSQSVCQSIRPEVISQLVSNNFIILVNQLYKDHLIKQSISQ